MKSHVAAVPGWGVQVALHQDQSAPRQVAVGMTPTAGVGAGGGSTQNSAYQPRGATQNGGVFAGGGAMAVTQTDNFIFYAGNGGTGAGGGAGARLTSSNVTSIQSGAGGSGVVLIQILEKS